MVRERRRGGGQAHLSSEWRGRESLCYVMLCYVMLLAQGRLTYHLSGEGENRYVMLCYVMLCYWLRVGSPII